MQQCYVEKFILHNLLLRACYTGSNWTQKGGVHQLPTYLPTYLPALAAFLLNIFVETSHNGWFKLIKFISTPAITVLIGCPVHCLRMKNCDVHCPRIKDCDVLVESFVTRWNRRTLH